MVERVTTREQVRRGTGPGREALRERPGATADVITSRENKWLKKFRAALRGKGPEQGEAIGLEGPKLIEEAIRAGLEALALLVSDSGERDLEGILRAASGSKSGIPRSRILRTTDKLFAGVAGTETPQGVAGLFLSREWGFEDVLRGAATREGAYRGEPALVVVMAGVQDPGNVGTIVRSAEAFGATGGVAMRGTADPWSPKALRASAGSALRLPVLRGVALPVLMVQLKIAGAKIFATKAAPGETNEISQDLTEPCAIFVGSEGAGLPSEVISSADGAIAIPMSKEVESLNAGVAAAVVLYEAAKQRRSATTDEHR
jgi:RNA methyltransferase, TrmH family